MLRNGIPYALRLMRRSPGFTAVAVLTLALGIGANTAISSLFYTVMLRGLPVEHPEQLVELLRDSATELHWPGYWAWDQYEYLRDHNHAFSGITGMGFDNLAPVRVPGSDPEALTLDAVPGNYFQALGLKPAIGRLIGPEDAPAASSSQTKTRARIRKPPSASRRGPADLTIKTKHQESKPDRLTNYEQSRRQQLSRCEQSGWQAAAVNRCRDGNCPL